MNIVKLSVLWFLGTSAALAQTPPMQLSQSHSYALVGTVVSVAITQSGATKCEWLNGGTSATDPEVRSPAVLAPTMTRTVTLPAGGLRHGMVCTFPVGDYMIASHINVETLTDIHQALTCMPFPLGKGSIAYADTYNIDTTNTGACAVWFCPASPKPTWYGACATARELKEAPYTLAQLFMLGEQKTTEVWKVSPTRRSLTDTERGVLERIRAANAAAPVFPVGAFIKPSLVAPTIGVAD